MSIYSAYDFLRSLSSPLHQNDLEICANILEICANILEICANILEIFIFSLAPGQIGNDKANHVFVTLPLAFTGSHLHTGKITLATLPTFLQFNVYFIHIQ